MSKNQYKSTKKAPFPLKKIGKTDFVMGVDEAGRGAWAGPVVAACVAWIGRNPVKNILKDSKKMTAKERKKTYEEIIQLGEKWKLVYWIGIVPNTVIDEVGIREANRRAMEIALRAIINEEKNSVIPESRNASKAAWEISGIQANNLLQSEAEKTKGSISDLDSGFRRNDGNCLLLIDGRDNYSFDIPDLPQPEYIVRGDSKVRHIMAGSILAKVTRDRLMIEYGIIFPWYSFEKHKWYGTEAHQIAIDEIGVCEIHRTSFKPLLYF